MNKESFFSKQIIRWGKENPVDHPWKSTKDPYTTWISEIIMQQTRIEQGTPYFLRFMKAFPNLKSLAEANEEQVLKQWEGLGYYSRARNLHFTAKHIYFDLQGRFPNNYDDLLKLKGVGKYTAAAIASFSFGEHRAVVDGNVIRVAARYFGSKADFQKTKEKRALQKQLESIILETDPAKFNQAIMDFGARACTPQNPRCEDCPLKEKCIAFEKEAQHEYPTKKKAVKKRNRYFHYFHFSHKNEIYIGPRAQKDIWEGLFEFPLYEGKTLRTKQAKSYLRELFKGDMPLLKATHEDKRILSHQIIYMKIYKVEMSDRKKVNSDGYEWCAQKLWKQYAFPKSISCYLLDL